MNKPAAGRRLRVANGTLLLLVILLSAAAAGVLALPNSTDAREARVILRSLSELTLDGPASPSKQDQYDKALMDARLFLRSMPDSKRALKIRVLVAAAEGRVTEAEKILSEVRTGLPDPQDLNELGMVYWGLGRENPSNFFRALGFFEQAARLAPYDPTPRYNLVRAYKELHLKEFVDGASKQYQGIEPAGLFHTGGKAEVADDSVLISDLMHSLQLEDIRRANDLLDRFPDTFRPMALEGALNPRSDTFDETTKFVLDYYGNTQQDLTMRAILLPMEESPRGAQVLDARKRVQKGLDAYFKGNSEESLRWYDSAQESIRNANSVFDELWINLKRADTLLRSTRSGSAINLLDKVIERSRELGFDCCTAMRLSPKRPRRWEFKIRTRYYLYWIKP
jgi:tetratricopeptide (TPR) repeat protein